jgi:hypothetical protein
MIYLRLCLTIFILFILCGPLIEAQQNNSQKRSEADEALRQKAFDLLESLAGQTSILQSPENRARLNANLVDSLWDHDEQKARALLTSVQEDINAGVKSQEGDRLADSERRRVFLQLRVTTVERVSRHDPVLALSFFRATQLPSDPTSPDTKYLLMQEHAFEMRLAKDIAANNPEIALELARQSLAHSFSVDVLPLLRQLNRKHKEQALTLYDEIVTKLKRADLVKDLMAFELAANLAQSFGPPAIDEGRFRDLVNVLTRSAIASGCNGKLSEEDERAYYCQRVGTLLPLIRKVDPTRAASLKQWEPEEDEYPANVYLELNEVAQDGSLEEIVALAKKYPQSEEMIYWRALQKARESGDIEKARKIVTDYTGNPDFKQSLMETIDRQEKLAASVREHLKEIDAEIDKMSTNEERVQFLLFVSSQLAQTDQAEGAKLLERANSLIDTMKPGKEQLGSKMFVALMYCWKGNSRGLTMMEALMPKVNQVVGAAMQLDGYENSYLRDGEWNMTREGILGALLTFLAEHAAYFAWCDFDRSVSIAGQFDRPEIRLMAQVKLAQGILAGHPKPLTFGNRIGFD